MSADSEFERRVGSELRSVLDRAAGPHPEWATSPAAAVVATDPAGPSRTVPWRLMAVAAVLLIGSAAAVILSRPDIEQEAGVPGCPTLADYAAASAQPSPLLGEAPGVTFPPVAPTATMTTGLLQPGDWAVMANDEGPALQIRVRDIRDCGRLPDLRSYQGGSIHLATVDVRFLRGNAGMGWLGVQSLFEGAIGGQQGSVEVGHVSGVPGTDYQSWLDAPEGWAFSGTYIFDVPRTDKQVAIDHPTNNTISLPGLEVNDLDSPRARWVIREGDPTGGNGTVGPFPSPGATPTTGQIRLGDDVTFVASDGTGVVRFSEVDEVPAYPGLLPGAGNVFVEVQMRVLSLDVRVMQPSDLRATGADGRDLDIVQDAYNADRRRGVLPNLLQEAGSDFAWIVVEAPSSGPVRLEYRHHGNDDAMFWIQLRD